jgi:hypothetical protein
MQSVYDLTGQTLTGVCFVMHYVEFHFSGPLLRVLVPLTLVRRGDKFAFPGEGSRDALCSLIESVVEDITLVDDVSLTVRFRGGSTLIIPLEKKPDLDPEAAHFVPGLNQPLQIF